MLTNSFNQDNKIIFKNFSYLSILRFFNIGVKFLLVAYLIRILGEVNYGIYTWSDSIIQFFLIFINFGFNIYAAKYIVKDKNDATKTNTIISSIFTIKFFFFIMSFFILSLLWFFDPIKNHFNIILLMLLMGLGEVFYPIWYFQGIEKLKPATIIIIVSRGLLVVGTFLLVKTPNDLYLFVLLVVLSNFIMGALGFFTLKKKYNYSFKIVSVKTLKKFIKEAYMFFFGMFFSLTFNLVTIFLIGIFFTMDYVSGFDISLKIVLVFIIPFDMLQQAVFPTISRNKNKQLLKQLIFGSFLIGIALFFILFFFSTELLSLFGGYEMTKYSSVLQTLAIIVPLVAVSLMLGSCTLIVFGHNSDFNVSLILSSIVYIIIILLLILYDKITFWNLIYLRVFSDFILLIIRIYYTVKRKIFI